jgi:geranylgeranyl diphosphate synthase type II
MVFINIFVSSRHSSMHSFSELVTTFSASFNSIDFTGEPATLYEPGAYFLGIGGKRIRPVLCLMGCELFDEITPDAYHVANAIELFHNFTLIHDDIMDKAPLRRGMETVHTRYGESTALLTGDVMLIKAYDHINKVGKHIHRIMHQFNKTAREVCEGQQRDMDFEKQAEVGLAEYIRMIELKTSVLIAASLEMGAILGGAGEGNARHLYEFGRHLGIAFQVQDDYLDAFGDPEKFGKKVGGDIVANKKTFLMIHALEVANTQQRAELEHLLTINEESKVNRVLEIFKRSGVDEWAKQLKDKYLSTAFQHLEDIAVVSVRKKPLQELAAFLVQRDY